MARSATNPRLRCSDAYTLAAIDLVVPIECDIVACRRRVHLQRTIVRQLHRDDDLPRQTTGSTDALGEIAARGIAAQLTPWCLAERGTSGTGYFYRRFLAGAHFGFWP